MTEQEYIDTVDLAKVRAAASILLGVFCQRRRERGQLLMAIRALDELDEMLYRKVDAHIDVEHDQEPSK